MNGLVSIVGAGPGDPGLLTLKAAERLREADVVVYDALVRPELLAHAPAAALRLFAGKRAGRHSVAQGRINELLVRLGRRGLRVVRLKGGDPFVFGRGAEEAEALSRAGVAWEVVPGVSSCLAGPALAGIPATDRRLSSAVTVVAGHACPGAPDVEWERLSPKGTLVVLMGVGALEEICARLLALGWPPALPAAACASMGWPEQRVVVSGLAGLPRAAREAGLEAPAVLVFGEVVGLRETLQGGEHVERERGGGQEAAAARA